MTTRNTTFQLKSSNTPNQSYPSNLLTGEPIVNTADGIMLFSGVTTSTSGWTQSPSGATFFEVGSNLYNLKIRNQITSYSGITNLSGKFLSGTSNGFVLANISDITSSPFTGGTVSGATIFTGGLSANTISATTYLNLPRDVFVSGGTYNSGSTSLTFTNTSGGTFNVTGVTGTYVKSGIFYPFSGRGTSSYSYNTGGGFNVTGYTYGISTADGIENTPLYLSLGATLGTKIQDIQVQSDGKILIGGKPPYLTRLNPDGTNDTIFETNLGTNFNDTVRSVRIQSDGKILVGGEFTTFDGNSIPYFIRLNSDGTEDTAFTSNLGTSFNFPVFVIRIQPDGKILVGGNFTNFNSTSVGYFTRLNSNGSLDSTFNSTLSTSFNGNVYAIELQPDGKILVGGNFAGFNGNNIPRLTRLNPDGSEDTAFNANLGFSFTNNNPVYSIKIQPDNKILVGGDFTQFNIQTRYGLIRLFSDGTEDAPFYANSDRFNAVYDIQVQPDGKILVGGNFSTNGRYNIGRLLDTGVNDTVFNNNIGLGPNGTVYVINIQTNGLIIVGGEFTSFNSIDRENINYLYNFTQFSYADNVGNDGSNSGRWRFISGYTSPANPFGGNFITDDTDLSAILDISASIYGINGANYYSWWSELKTAVDNSYVTHLQITELGNNSVVGIYEIFGITDNTTYFDIHIDSILVSNGYLGNNKEYTLSWIYGVTGTGGGSSSGNYLPLSGGTVTGNTTFTSGVSINYIDFDTTPNVPAPTGGTVYFDSTENALSYKPITPSNDVTVNIGQESLIRIYNNLGVQINNGQALHITGSTSGSPTVSLAVGTGGDAVQFQISGIATHNIPNLSYGFMTVFGVVRDINLTGFTVGEQIYLSQTVPGGFSSYSGLSFTGRTCEVGHVIDNSSSGKLQVTILNEIEGTIITTQENNILSANNSSTGIFNFSGLSITTPSGTTFNVGPVEGWIIDNVTEPANPSIKLIIYPGSTGNTALYVSSATETYILLTSGLTITQQTTFPTPQQRRQNLYLGKFGHANRQFLINAFNEPDSSLSPVSQLRDMFTPIKLINGGIYPSENGNSLTFNSSAGVLYGLGIGYITNKLDPNSLSVSGTSPCTFQYRTQTGGTASNTTLITPGVYDNNGVVTSVGGGSNSSTNQRIYLVQNGQFRLQYGQQVYGSLAAAIEASQSEAFTTFSNFRDNAILIGVLSVNKNATNLSDITQARFLLTSKFGETVGAAGGISTTNLQQAYNNSSFPAEIITNSTLGALHIQNGSGSPDNVSKIFDAINTAGDSTAFIRADGSISGTTFTGTTGLFTTGITGVTISATTYLNIPSSSFSGGTVAGATNFTNGLTSNTMTTTALTVNGNLSVTGNTGVGISPSSSVKIWGYSTVASTTGVQGNGTTGGVYGVTSTASGFGVRGDAVSSIGVYGISIGDTGTNIGVQGNTDIDSGGSPTNIGGKFTAVNGGTNYSLQLSDGTESIGRYLKCITSDGKANWADVPSSSFTGGTVSGPTNFTNGLTASTISATTIYGDGSNLTGVATFQQILRITSLGI
jgi:uncharacterized delta-60 repeat protein